MADILLDCDGVLADFGAAVHAVVVGQHPDALPPDQWTEWEFLDRHYGPGPRGLAVSALQGGQFWSGVPEIAGARAAVLAFRQAGHRVRFVTSPWTGCRDWAATRTDWLVRCMDARPGDVHIAGDKSPYLGRVFVDDKPDHVEAWQTQQVLHCRQPGRAFLFDQPYNRNAALRRLAGWTPAAVQAVLQAAGGA